ncbi:CD209 antigen-like protein E [Mugil cephalus]|uniref:CD209 antigen-like protein E n=1 Tax=Mugil cephalus TaxID=48193 RepID=UPI001FB645F6|nr:CD209 antigen-like protein E [Mugil cephalus]
MEEIYVNIEKVKPVSPKHSTNHADGNSAAELSDVKHNLTVFLQTSNNILSSVTEERDLLNSKLTKMTEELEELQHLSEQNKVCPASWKMFSGSCYFLSQEKRYWVEGRQDCKSKGADLVVIDSSEEQIFISNITKTYTWIGLNDREEEGTWKWVDGTPLILE